MNKPYTCHHCGTVFDLVPQDFVEQKLFGPDKGHLSGYIRVKCPGCFNAGYTVQQSIYMVDIDTMTVVT